MEMIDEWQGIFVANFVPSCICSSCNTAPCEFLAFPSFPLADLCHEVLGPDANPAVGGTRLQKASLTVLASNPKVGASL